jgi:phage tail-like protein
MAITIDQLLATLGVDASEALVVAGRFVIITRDPQPDEIDVPADSTVYLRVVDLDGAPAVPSTIDFRVYIDQGAGEVQAFDGTNPVAPWNGALAVVGQSTVADPYCFKDVRLDQAPTLFASEQDVTVHVALVIGASGWGYASWGHFPWGHTGGAPVVSDVYYTFTAADTIAPNILLAEAVDAETIRVTFDDSMALGGAGSGLADDVAAWQPSGDTVGITRLNVDPDPGVTLSVTAVSVVAGTNATQFDLTVNWEMTPLCLYQLEVRGTVTDSSGNPISLAVAQFTGFQPLIPDGRRFDYWRMMVPYKNRVEDASQDLRRFANCIAEVMRLLLSDVDRFTDQFDIDKATDAQVDLMLYDMGNPFDWIDLDLTAAQRRKLLRVLVEIYKLKGTDSGIESVVLFLLGEVVRVVEAMEGGWVLGVDELGEGAIAQLTSNNPETYNFAALPMDLDLLIDGTAVTFTFVSGDFVNPAAATAREVADALSGRRFVPATGTYITRPEGSLTGGAAYVDIPGTAAVGIAGAAEPYALNAGDTLELTVNGNAEVVTFHADDFAVSGAATADEVAARIELDVAALDGYSASGVLYFATRHTGADAEIIATGGTWLAALSILIGTTWTGTDLPKVTIYSSTAGADASIQATGGGARSVLGFPTTVSSGTGGAILAPSESYTLYSFDIETNGLLESDVIAIIRRIANYMKPAHTHLINVRPAPGLPWPEGWLIGIDELDISTMLAS